MTLTRSSLVLLLVAAGIGSMAACSSSSDPSPTPTDAGKDAPSTTGDGGASGDGAAIDPTLTCVVTPAKVSCERIGFGVSVGACSYTGSSCDDGSERAADCDADGNCVCSIDGVPQCSCSSGVKTCEGGSCECSGEDNCCFPSLVYAPPSGGDGG